MILFEQRDPQFWRDVASHPLVSAGLNLGDADIGKIAMIPEVLPLASKNGGFLVCSLDVSKCVYELHALFKPEGWGREAHAGGKEIMNRLFDQGVHVVLIYEAEGNWRSRPPKSFGWRLCGDFAWTPHLGRRVRTWSLSAKDWHASPAFIRGLRTCLQQ